jgi:hypothetical protein
MFGPGIMSVFTSRWKALWWSAGIMLTAYCSVPSAEESTSSDTATSQEVQAAKQAVDALGHTNDQPSQD